MSKRGGLRRVVLGTLLGGSLAWAGFGGVAQAAMPIKIGFYPGATFQTPIFVADAMGYYKSEGLDPTFIPTISGPVMISELGSGAVDVGFTAPSNVAFARQQGLRLAYFMGNVTMPWVLIARNNVALPHKGHYPDIIRDLKGMSWGVYGRGSDGEMFMRVMAADAGLDLDKDMAWIGVGGPATGLPALKTDKIQVYLTLDPAPQVASADRYGQTVLDLRKGEGPADFKGVVYQGADATVKWLESHPKEVAAMIRAHEKSFCFITNPRNFDRLVQILEKKVPLGGLTKQQFEEMVRINIPTFTVTFSEQNFKVWNKMMLKSGMVKEPLPPSEILWKSVPQGDPSCGR